MNPNPDRVESLFAAVLAVPSEQRGAYLDEACGGDAELRKRVEALLQAHADAGSFLESPVAAQPINVATRIASAFAESALVANVLNNGAEISAWIGKDDRLQSWREECAYRILESSLKG